MYARIASLVVLAAGLGAAEAGAQSLLANRGLGYVIHPTDARLRGMGGTALGIEGADLSWTNPADVAGIAAPGLKFVYQHDAFDATFGERSHDGATARFPLIMGAFPVGSRAAISLGAASFLDQNWAVETRDTLFIGGDTVAVRDRFTSEGGVTQVRLGGAYRVLDGLSVGAGFDYYLGSVERGGGRIFPNEPTPGCCTAAWSYRGAGGSVGLEWRPVEALTIATAASFGGSLEAETSDSLATDASYDIPTRLSAGASGRVAGNLLLALSGEWAGWSGMNDALLEVGGARDVVSLNGGLEWDGATIFNRPLPIRLGARRSELPFAWGTPGAPSDWADETAFTAGLGTILGNGAVRADLAAERGWRGGEAAGLDESFWRTTLSVAILGR